MRPLRDAPERVPHLHRSYTSRRCAMRVMLMSFAASSMMYTTASHRPEHATDLCSLSASCILLALVRGPETRFFGRHEPVRYPVTPRVPSVREALPERNN